MIAATKVLRHTLILVALLTWQGLYGQDYKVEIDSSAYQPLTEYRSIGIERQGDIFYDLRVNLPFAFPFFGETYDYLNVDMLTSGVWMGEDFEAMHIFAMTAEFEYDPIWDTTMVESDIRDAFVEIDGVQAYVLEFAKARLGTDATVEEFDSHMDHQLWLWESGMIEIHLGSNNLDSSDVFTPGLGFTPTFLNTDSVIVLGPLLGIAKVGDEDNTELGVGVAAPDVYKVMDIIGRIRYMPPEGTIFRFLPEGLSNNIDVSTVEDTRGPRDAYVVSSYWDVPDAVVDESYVIYDVTGTIASSGIADRRIDLASLYAGQYYFKTYGGRTITIIKL